MLILFFIYLVKFEICCLLEMRDAHLSWDGVSRLEEKGKLVLDSGAISCRDGSQCIAKKTGDASRAQV
jgi:hypothetical protein